jgi:hypothetical protein
LKYEKAVSHQQSAISLATSELKYEVFNEVKADC